MVVSFNDSVFATLGDTLKVDVVPMRSHEELSDMEMEILESKSKLPNLESRISTAS
ncbi:hypothetical protein FS749_003330 [Ceratobasidium sp. UAMH 11750]|nr:hypothetical protein FS749_003330 [Ceratobasidium sp. UAMH 11750]